jgi:hypothetical protein
MREYVLMEAAGAWWLITLTIVRKRWQILEPPRRRDGKPPTVGMAGRIWPSRALALEGARSQIEIVCGSLARIA